MENPWYLPGNMRIFQQPCEFTGMYQLNAPLDMQASTPKSAELISTKTRYKKHQQRDELKMMCLGKSGTFRLQLATKNQPTNQRQCKILFSQNIVLLNSFWPDAVQEKLLAQTFLTCRKRPAATGKWCKHCSNALGHRSTSPTSGVGFSRHGHETKNGASSNKSFLAFCQGVFFGDTSTFLGKSSHI